MAAAVEQAALAELRERRPDRAIETNVEFWAAVILDFARVPATMMPAMFTCGRTAGWCAHILEQKRLGKLVRPGGHLRRPGAPQPGVRRGLGRDRPAVTADPVFTSAARAFAALVREIPQSGWAGPGLGEWDLRALVGHTSRSLITVCTYLKTTAERADVASPQDYYALIRDSGWIAGPAEIVERGRQAGRDLGSDPAATIDAWADRALADVAAVDDPLIAVIGGLGIRLHTYLPTRVFELAVHSLDIARARGSRSGRRPRCSTRRRRWPHEPR